MTQPPADGTANQSSKGEEKQSFSEPVWTYRGYQLRSSEFVTAMVHFFRAEVARANIWRQRLDMSFNWAVITTAAAISFAFTETEGSHVAVLLDILLVTFFLYIESRRNRYYELWSYRVRLMETDFFAAMLVPPFHPAPDWAESLAESLLHPTFPVSIWEALGRRLRRNYIWIYVVVGLAWFVKIALHPTAAQSWEEFFQRASIGDLPGQFVVSGMVLAYITLLIVSILTVGLRRSAGEILPRFGGPLEDLKLMEGRGVRAWFRPSRKRRQLLTLIVTEKPDQISERIMKDMMRGVTVLPGSGAFTKVPRPVLICALTVTEVPKLRALVNAEDPGAFVIVSPAQEIFGKGFVPLVEED